MSADILICVRGGVAEVLKKKRGLSVEIRDYDIDNEDGDHIKKDSTGHPYCGGIWDATEYFGGEEGEDE